jgi:tetratricopeptide (TPR) repeat protein
VIVLVALGVLRTWTYIEKWNNRDAFYAYSFAEQPESLKIALLESYVDFEEGRLDEARRLLDALKSRHPEYWEIWKRYALVDEKAGDWAAAAADWKQAFYLRPDPPTENRLEAAMAEVAKRHAATQNGTSRSSNPSAPASH